MNKKPTAEPSRDSLFGKLFALCVKYRELILYIIFGVVTTVVNWIVYALMVRLLKVDLSSFTADGVIRMLLQKTIKFSEFVATNGKQLWALFIANLIAWVAGVAVAFVTNKIWVFESHIKSFHGVMKELGLFVGSRLVTGIIEWFGLPLVIMLGMNQTLFGVQGFFAKVLISVIVVILNYIFSKLIVFKNKNKSKANSKKEEVI